MWWRETGCNCPPGYCFASEGGGEEGLRRGGEIKGEGGREEREGGEGGEEEGGREGRG